MNILKFILVTLMGNFLNLGRLCSKLTTVPESVKFLQDKGVIPNTKQCPKCGETMSRIGMYLINKILCNYIYVI